MRPLRRPRHRGRVVSRDEAVKAAAEAMVQTLTCMPSCAQEHAEIAVDAVWPVIERAVRAQAAAEVRAEADRHGDEYGLGLDRAARIVEGP